jgi:hypothetical protein
MIDSPAVLVLVKDSAAREDVRQRLTELEVRPIAVRADRAIEAVREFRPIAVVLDEAHAASAPDDFLESTCSHHVRLITLPDDLREPSARDLALRDAASAQRFY